MLDAKCLESDVAFFSKHLGYMNLIFEDASDFRFCLWEIHKYKEFTEFIKKLRVCNMDVIPPQELTPSESLVQEAMHE